MKKTLASITMVLMTFQFVIADQSASFKVDVGSFNNSGELSSSANFNANDTLVNFVNGEFGNSANYTLGSGLVYLEQLCGNDILEFGEKCDDGNKTNGDGCNSVCQLEVNICGNGILEVGEQCDDGNLISGDGCNNICNIENITPPPSGGGGGGGGGYGGISICGNGLRQGNEQCDDGNQINGDGCSSICKIESNPIIDDEDLKPAAPENPTEPEEATDPQNPTEPNQTVNFDFNLIDGAGFDINLDEENETEEEGVLRTIKIKARPEKRVNPNTNWGNSARLQFYSIDEKRIVVDTTIQMNTIGWNLTESRKIKNGRYHISLKGLSHLTKVLRNVVIDDTTETIDFTELETFEVIAGDVHESKDDFINGLDISAAVDRLYTTSIDADLNRDGIVNGLDIAIVVENIYRSGEKI